jgi:hypothetical protein
MLGGAGRGTFPYPHQKRFRKKSQMGRHIFFPVGGRVSGQTYREPSGVRWRCSRRRCRPEVVAVPAGRTDAFPPPGHRHAAADRPGWAPGWLPPVQNNAAGPASVGTPPPGDREGGGRILATAPPRRLALGSTAVLKLD